MSTHKRLFSLFLCLILLCALLPHAAPSARADGMLLYIRNYEDLAELFATGSNPYYYYELRPDADFGWPTEKVSLAAAQEVQLSMCGDWTIPENVSLTWKGQLSPGFHGTDNGLQTEYHMLTVNGTLDMSDGCVFSTWKLVVNGTLISNTLHADEGVVGPTGALQPDSDSGVNSLTFYSGPKFKQEEAANSCHWTIYEGASINGSLRFYSEESPVTGAVCAPLLEANGTVATDVSFGCNTNGVDMHLKGAWVFSDLYLFNNSSLILEGSVKTPSLDLSGNLSIPEGSSLDLEPITLQTKPGGLISATDGSTITVNGNLTLGVASTLRKVRFLGAGTIHPLAKDDFGTQAPFYVNTGGLTNTILFTEIVMDREAYGDLVATSLVIDQNWTIKPLFLLKPQSASVNVGDTVSFTVNVKWADSYRWQYKAPDGSYTECDSIGTGYDTDTLTLTAKPEYDGYKFRCVATNPNGSTNSSPATLTVQAAASDSFLDVAEGAYYFDAVVWAIGHQPVITTGTDETHFSPNRPCTRGQAVTFLWRAMGCPDPGMDESPFTDVDENAFYYKAMLWAVEHGVTAGTSSTSFSPNTLCSRGQMVTFLWRAMGSPDPGIEQSPFTDVDENAFYYKAMLWALEQEITSGTSGTSFSPDAACTRAQAVTFLWRALEN